ncbi:MAG: hypothetical protein PHW65_03485 [Dehalococcoidales bacterium]|nr:hypothetical protein [Dehalococcoidales bacterium]
MDNRTLGKDGKRKAAPTWLLGKISRYPGDEQFTAKDVYGRWVLPKGGISFSGYSFLDYFRVSFTSGSFKDK